ncbi:MAG: DUF2085 domain-containing protein [Methanothrix sp.]|nr:MAG: DUF2085 domain-containing protein [Methanothrix sp.]
MDLIKFTWDKKLGPIGYLNIKDKQYGFCFCHRKPERCIPFLGLERYLCSRCIGILFGEILAIILFTFNYLMNFTIFFIFTIPLIIDGLTQLLNLRKSNNLLRLITGLLFGIGINYLLGLFL